jgi:hypothetical protein
VAEFEDGEVREGLGPASEVGDVDEVHPDWWECRTEVDYVRSWLCARQMAAFLIGLVESGDSGSASVGLRDAVELYGVGMRVLADGTAIAWIGENAEEALILAEMTRDEMNWTGAVEWPLAA